MCYEIVIFPIRKRHFRVRGWSGAFSEPLERKKDKTKCSYSPGEKTAPDHAGVFYPKRNLSCTASLENLIADLLQNLIENLI